MQLSVSVTDETGAPALGLKRQNFQTAAVVLGQFIDCGTAVDYDFFDHDNGNYTLFLPGPNGQLERTAGINVRVVTSDRVADVRGRAATVLTSQRAATLFEITIPPSD